MSRESRTTPDRAKLIRDDKGVNRAVAKAVRLATASPIVAPRKATKEPPALSRPRARTSQARR